MTIKKCKWCEQRYVTEDENSEFCSTECETIFHEQKQYFKEAADDNTIKN